MSQSNDEPRHFQPLHSYLEGLIDRWEEIKVMYDRQPLPILLADVPDPQVQAAIIVKLLIEEYEIETIDESQEESLYAQTIESRSPDSGD